MDGYGGGGSIEESSKVQDINPFGASSTGDTVFDASQYEFFGNDAVEEVELGGLEDAEDDLALVGFEEEEFLLEREEGDALGSLSEIDDRSNTFSKGGALRLSDIDDLSSSFSKLKKDVSGPTSAGVGREWDLRESSSAAELARGGNFANLFDQRDFNAEPTDEGKKWSCQPHSSPHLMESNSLQRTSSYPEKQYPHEQRNPHQKYSSEPILIPKSPFTSYPSPGGRPLQASPNGHHPSLPYHHVDHQMPVYSSKISPFSSPQLQLNAFPHGSQFGGNLPQLPHGLPVNSRLSSQLVNQNSLYPGGRSFPPNDMSPQQVPHQNGLVPPKLPAPQHSQQTRIQHPFPPSFGHLSQSQFSPHLSLSPPMFNDFDNHRLPDLRDQKAISMLRSRQGMRYPHQGFDSASRKGDSGWPRFRSKHMTADEIENIHRMQLAATHGNDPYVDDYHHQACVAKKSAGAKLKHHFCPASLMDSYSRARASNEPHAFLQVDALGRVSFSSIRRPRPLLEVESPNSSGGSGGGGVESKLAEKPLEQEPMLAARVSIEDGFRLLLDVDDIDRFLQFNQLQDGGAQLRHRRQVLLEGLASSLQLVDPLGKNGHTVDLAPKDDLVFLRIVSLPKGRKLLLRYLELLLPGELTRVICMAIFRHLRFLFGNLPADPAVSTTTTNIAKTVSSCIHHMELKSIAACLASVVCSAEHPPLRPVGSPAGDGASVILKSVLDRATELLTDPHAASLCSTSNRAFWQASFDAFFSLLTKYCFNKYDSIVQSFISHGSLDAAAVESDVAKAISREMPIELLRASLPHTGEQQKKQLLELAKRSMPASGFSGQGGGSESS